MKLLLRKLLWPIRLVLVATSLKVFLWNIPFPFSTLSTSKIYDRAFWPFTYNLSWDSKSMVCKDWVWHFWLPIIEHWGLVAQLWPIYRSSFAHILGPSRLLVGGCLLVKIHNIPSFGHVFSSKKQTFGHLDVLLYKIINRLCWTCLFLRLCIQHLFLWRYICVHRKLVKERVVYDKSGGDVCLVDSLAVFNRGQTLKAVVLNGICEPLVDHILVTEVGLFHPIFFHLSHFILCH